LSRHITFSVVALCFNTTFSVNVLYRYATVSVVALSRYKTLLVATLSWYTTFSIVALFRRTSSVLSYLVALYIRYSQCLFCLLSQWRHGRQVAGELQLRGEWTSQLCVLRMADGGSVATQRALNLLYVFHRLSRTPVRWRSVLWMYLSIFTHLCRA